jgi:tetratricopeptide (TPR) repeat protein
MHEAGMCLRTLGRLTEAVQAIQAGLDDRLSLEDWKNAAVAASNLSQLYLSIGDLPQSLVYAERSIELADKSTDSFQRIINRVTLADALHQAGQLSEAEAAFHEAEQMQKAMQPEYPLLYSLQGYRYCDLLLEQGKYMEVHSRLAQTIQIARQLNRLLDIGLGLLSLGRTYLLQAQEHKIDVHSQAVDYMNQAVNGLRLAGIAEFISCGLLARSELHIFKRDFCHARADLDEALSIAERGGMGLYEADCHLGYAKLYVPEGEKEKARESWAKAKEMIERMGYHRRDKDVAEIERQLEEMPDE